MSLTLTQTLTAVAPGITSSFGASGGTGGPYTYSVVGGGAGGSINSSGIYTAPAALSTNPAQLFDTIQAVDSLGNMGSAKIFVGDALLLVCDIIQNQMGLPQGRVYLWDQKIMEPKDQNLFVVVSVLNCKPYGNTKTPVGSSGGFQSQQSVNMAATLQIDVQSRGIAALRQKEAVLLAIKSDYAEQQMNANGFFIAPLPPGSQFVNLSSQDGAAIPYRFTISIVVHYIYTQNQNPGYMVPTNPPVVNYVQS